MGFKKYEVLVRKNSSAKIDNVIKMFKRAINNKQNSDSKNLWAANVFDLRTLKEYMIFSDKAAKTFNIIDTYSTKAGEVINGVMKLGQKIMDVEKTIKDGIQKNSDLIINIVEPIIPKVPEIPQDLKDKLAEIDNLEQTVTQLNSTIEEFNKIKEDVQSKINTIEQDLGVKVQDITQVLNTLQTKIQDVETNISQIDPDVLQKVTEIIKNDEIDKIFNKIQELTSMQDKINNLEEKIIELTNTIDSQNSDIIDDQELEAILTKLANGEELTPEEKQKLEEALGTSQGYVV
jgi:uncharacterized protein YoxC